jgi:AmmeMemoRadiSam system protein B
MSDRQAECVRPPAVAGQFYPAEPAKLKAMVERFLADANPPAVAPKAVIAPHAGYVYSGATAGEAFAAFAGVTGIKRVVITGPAHYVAFRGIAVPRAAAFATPLGTVPLDAEALAATAELPFVRADGAPHAPEHALEVELPFLQTVLADFSLVPLLVGDARPEEAAEVLGRVWGGPETLIVVSSDLSHYLPYDAAVQTDAATAEAIERGEWAALSAERACGYLAVAGLLIEAAKRGLKPRRLALMNSGDTAGARNSVVGYGAWAFEEEK